MVWYWRSLNHNPESKGHGASLVTAHVVEGTGSSLANLSDSEQEGGIAPQRSYFFSSWLSDNVIHPQV